MLDKPNSFLKKFFPLLENSESRDGLQGELFFIYLENHLASYRNIVLYLCGLLIISHMVDKNALAIIFENRLFFTLAFISFILQYSHYAYLKKWKIYNKRALSLLILNKIFYTTAFLIFLFYPIEVDNFYKHSLSYFFILVAMVRFTSVSSAFRPFFLAEMAIYIAFTVYVETNNYLINHTSLLGPSALFITYLFLLLAGLKNNQISRKLVDKKSQLQIAVQQEQEAMRAKSEFLASISHEIRTPLSGIMGMINFLKDSPLQKKQQECIDIIDSCSQALLNTLNDLLDMSKMEAGKFTIDKVNFDIYHMVNNIHKLMELKAHGKKIGLTLIVHNDIPRYIVADPNRLQQIIMNLVSNAIKFTGQGSVTINLSMRHSGSPTLRFEIVDTGMGISEEDQKKLFQNFSQVDSSISRKFGGTGLGLSISKQLVELMEGTIGVTSVEGQGSTFWFEIPCIVEDVMQAQDLALTIIIPQGIRILVAEDNHVNRLIVGQLLEKKGCRPDMAHDGTEAVVMAGRNSYDLILMDMQMPGKDGLQATRQIRALGEEYQKIPIIGLTANSLEQQIQDCLDAGMVDHISKPIDPEILYRKIALYTNHIQAVPGMHAEIRALTGKLGELERVLGNEYVLTFRLKAGEEMEKLFRDMQAYLTAKDFAGLAWSAHDLKSVSGSIDRMDIVDEVEIIENLCRYPDESRITTHLATVDKMIHGGAAMQEGAWKAG